MAIRLLCPFCQRILSAHEENRGKIVCCPCGQRLEVSSSVTASSPLVVNPKPSIVDATPNSTRPLENDDYGEMLVDNAAESPQNPVPSSTGYVPPIPKSSGLLTKLLSVLLLCGALLGGLAIYHFSIGKRQENTNPSTKSDVATPPLAMSNEPEAKTSGKAKRDENHTTPKSDRDPKPMAKEQLSEPTQPDYTMKFGFTLRERQTIYLEIVSAESNAMQAAIDKYGHKPRDLDPFAYAVKFHDYFDTELARRMDDILTRYDITKQKASLIVQEGKDGGWPTTKLDPRRTQN